MHKKTVLVIDPNTPVKYSSDYLKIVVASYFRFVRQMEYVTTELDFKDVIATTGKRVYEVECKISKNDLLNEIKKDTKIKKHNQYELYKQTGKSYHYVPNYFYYIITPKMYLDQEVIDIIEDINPKYGIMVCDDWYAPKIVKEAKLLHNKNANPKLLNDIIKRLVSENIILRKEKYLKQISEH